MVYLPVVDRRRTGARAPRPGLAWSTPPRARSSHSPNPAAVASASRRPAHPCRRAYTHCQPHLEVFTRTELPTDCSPSSLLPRILQAKGGHHVALWDPARRSVRARLAATATARAPALGPCQGPDLRPAAPPRLRLGRPRVTVLQSLGHGLADSDSAVATPACPAIFPSSTDSTLTVHPASHAAYSYSVDQSSAGSCDEQPDDQHAQ